MKQNMIGPVARAPGMPALPGGAKKAKIDAKTKQIFPGRAVTTALLG